MADVELRVGAKDDGALALLQSILSELRRLNTSQARSARTTKQMRDEKGRFIKATNESVAAMKREQRQARLAAEAQIQAARETARAQQQATQAALANVQSQQKATREAIRQAQEQARVASQQTKATQQQTQAQIAAAAKQARASQQETQSRLAQFRAEQAAAREQLRVQREAASARVAQAKADVAQAKLAQEHARNQGIAARNNARAAQAQAQVALQAARQQAQALSQQARAQRQAGQAQLQAARLANQAANRQTRIYLQQQRLASRATSAANAQSGAIERLTKKIIAYAAVVGSVKLFAGFIREGLQFNQILETATLGIASVISATSEIRDGNGRMLDGAEALTGAYALATDQMRQLRIAGLQTAATTEQLVDAFQQAVGAGLAAGLNLDAIRQTTIQIVQAAGAIGVPLNQLNQEVRSILDATIDRNSRVARVLGITNEMVRQAKATGQLQEFLNERLSAFTVAGERAAETFAVVRSNIVEAMQVFAGTTTKPLFDQLTETGKTALEQVFDFDEGRISDRFSGLVVALQTVFGDMGALISNAIMSGVDALADLSSYLEDNQSAVADISAAFFDMLGAVGELAASVGGILVDIIQWGIETGVIEEAFETIASIARILADNPFILGGAAAIGVGVAAAASPWAVVAGLASALAIQLHGLATAEDEATEARNRSQESLLDNAGGITRLIKEYEALEAVKNDEARSDAETERARRRQESILKELIRLNPVYADRIQDAQRHHRNLVSVLNLEINAMERLLQMQFNQAVGASFAAQDTLTAMEAIKKAGGVVDEGQMSAAREQLNLTVRSAERLGEVLGEVKRQQRGDEAYTTKGLTRDPDAGSKTGGAKNDDKQRASAAVKVIRAQLKKQHEELENSLARTQVSYADYFSRLNEVQQKAIADEVAVQRALLSKTKDQGERAQILGEIEELQNQGAQALAQNAEDQRLAYERIQKDVQDAQVALLEASGRVAEAETLRIEQEFGELVRRLRAEGNAEGVAIVQALIDVRTASALVGQIEAQINRLQGAADRELQEIQTKVITGVIKEAEGRQQVLEVNERLLAGLVALRDQYSETMRTGTGATEETRQAALDLDNAISEVTEGVKEAEIATKGWQNQLASALQSDLANFFTDGIDQAESLGDAFRGLAKSVVDSIRRIIAQIIAYKIISATMGAAGIQVAQPFASGGFVRGPGTGTSDSIPARLSAGEYVLRASVVRDLGVDTLNSINFGRSRPKVRGRGVQRFAEGGLVQPGSGSANGGFDATVGLAPGLIVQEMRTREGTRAVIQIVGENRRAIRAALGLS